MVIQFSEKCADCEHVCGVKQRELDRFVQKFDILTKAEIAVALMVTSKDVLSLLSQTVPCVGCRRSVERLFNQLVQFQHPALEPLIITADGVLSIKHDLLFDSKTLYALFYIHGAKLNSVMESIPKSKKNKRCNLHSLDTHKTRSSGSWIDIWDLLSQECREDVVLVDADGLSDTLEAYLRKHRFCAECKSKVLRAYSILTGEVSCTKEKGYCPSLYEGLRCCTQERHIHMLCDTDFIARLIGLAEPELAGSSRRDRHAKTLEIAQEEVLTCLGIHVYERLHQIGQKLKAEEQTWQILFYLGMDALKKSFEMAVERKQGVSNLELVCKELLEEERIREQKRETKRQKKKKRRARLQTDLQNNALRRQISSECKCDSPKKSPTRIYSEQCRDHSSNLVSVENCRKSSNVDSFCQVVSGKGLPSSQKLECIETCCGCEEMNQTGKRLTMDNTGNSDCGYSSGAEGCENCGVQSSNESSDVICSDDLSNNEVFLVDCDGSGPNLDTNSCYNCGSANLKHGEQSLDQCNHLKQKFSIDHYPSLDQHRMMPLSLQAMLEASRSSDEDVISEEEIKQFRENESVHLRMRQELRETLRQRFKKMQQRAHCVGKTSYKTMDEDAVVRKLCNL